MKTKQPRLPVRLHFIDAYGGGGVAYFVYKGHTVEVRQYPATDRFYVDRGWGSWLYFVAVDGDSYPHGLTLATEGAAIREARRRIDKGEFEQDNFWRKYGSFCPDFHPDRPYWDKVRTAQTTALTLRSIEKWYHELVNVILVNEPHGTEWLPAWRAELKRLEAQYQEFGGNIEDLK